MSGEAVDPGIDGGDGGVALPAAETSERSDQSGLLSSSSSSSSSSHSTDAEPVNPVLPSGDSSMDAQPSPTHVAFNQPDGPPPWWPVHLGLSQDMFSFVLGNAAGQDQSAAIGSGLIPAQMLHPTHATDEEMEDDIAGQAFESFIFGQDGPGVVQPQMDLPTGLGPFAVPVRSNESWDIETFFERWGELWSDRMAQIPRIRNLGIHDARIHRPREISAQDVIDRKFDIQGIDWCHFQTTPENAREVRRQTTENFTSISIRRPRETFATPAFKANFESERSPAMSTSDRFFRFRETNTKSASSYSHWQLRHNLSASSRNAVFYSTKPHVDYDSDANSEYGKSEIKCFNPSAGTTCDGMNLQHNPNSEFPRMSAIACVSATNDVLVLGGLYESLYAVKSISAGAESAHTVGILRSNPIHHDGINHAHTFLSRRSGLPQAVFATNGASLQILDCNTNRLVGHHTYPHAINASATSPDSRLRVHVADDTVALVTEAETGNVIAKLHGHTDHGFACAWSPDGISMATGHQDGIVQIWDARHMSTAVHSLPAEMGGIRALEYSPLGSGPPVLVMAESVDFVSIVNARTYVSKQNIEFFGAISGISMPPDGDTLFIGNADPMYGGIMEFERAGQSQAYRCDVNDDLTPRTPEPSGLCRDQNQTQRSRTTSDIYERYPPELAQHELRHRQIRVYDWAAEQSLEHNEHVQRTKQQRWRRSLGLESIVF